MHPDPFPLSGDLLRRILDDELSDRFVCELVWQRLGYRPESAGQPWSAGPQTPPEWAESYPLAPELIAERPASVRLTRSIAAPYKQLLKEQLGFAGYRIGELHPRRTRWATAVNWLLAWLAGCGEPLPENGALPELPGAL